MVLFWRANPGPHRGPQFRCLSPQGAALARSDNSPDVITSGARELESRKGLLMGGRDQINNFPGLSHAKGIGMPTNEQISFL